VTVLESVAPMLSGLSALYGFGGRVLPVRVIDLKVREIEEDMTHTTDLLSREAIEAVTIDGADVIILGCTGFIGCAEAISANLRRVGRARPVIDPMPIAIMQAASFARAGLVPAPRDFSAH
jgi:allantoin racemase